MKLVNVLQIILVLIVIIMLIKPFKTKIDEAVPIKENHCLNEQSYYYRYEKWFIFTSRVRTTESNADYTDWECTKWEDIPSFGKMMLGQKLSYNKGFSQHLRIIFNNQSKSTQEETQ